MFPYAESFGLKRLAVRGTLWEAPAGIAYRATKWPVPALNAFCALLRAHFAGGSMTSAAAVGPRDAPSR
jgi:hypothetical protein